MASVWRKEIEWPAWTLRLAAFPVLVVAALRTQEILRDSGQGLYGDAGRTLGIGPVGGLGLSALMMAGTTGLLLIAIKLFRGRAVPLLTTLSLFSLAVLFDPEVVVRMSRDAAWDKLANNFLSVLAFVLIYLVPRLPNATEGSQSKSPGR
ncbi:MAG TPA: hypothetical protein VHE55_03795 [Fimbriimonadaceae bacterium]|nr:hypothetical protein [Fimbriimonadaceae bacterium]